MGRRSLDSRIKSLKRFLLPAAVLYLLFYIYPIGKLFADSLCSYNKMRTVRTFVGLKNYMNVFTDAAFYESSWITLRYIFFCVLFEFILGFAIALSLNKGFLGDKLAKSLFMTPLMLAPVVSGLTWKFMFSSQFGIFNQLLYKAGLISSPEAVLWLSNKTLAFVACCIAHIWVSTPFFIITILAGLKGVSKELYEAADIDGANKVQSLFYITIPSLKPLLATIILLKAIDAARGFDIIWVLAQGGPGTATQTLSIYLYKNMVQYNKVGYSSAMAIVFMAMIMVAARIFLKYLKPQGGGDA